MMCYERARVCYERVCYARARVCYERVCYERVCYARARVCYARERVCCHLLSVATMASVGYPTDAAGRATESRSTK